ncbi:MAG: type II toxin-antitoxin system HicA family toxin [Nitrospinota bacterium]
MTEVPSLDYRRIVSALQRAGWVVVRRGSHLRLHRHLETEILKLMIPAHRPVKRSTLARILKQVRLDLDEF